MAGRAAAMARARRGAVATESAATAAGRAADWAAARVEVLQEAEGLEEDSEAARGAATAARVAAVLAEEVAVATARQCYTDPPANRRFA